MPATRTLDHDITDALAELRGARADFEHSPNADTERVVEYAEWRLNGLLERRGRGDGEQVKSR